MRGIRGVRVRGYYRAGSLPELLARQGASVALILSAVPESFSLVLSESWAAGVPVIAPATGAFLERLSGRLSALDAPDAPTGGLLIAADASDEEIAAAVERARQMSWDVLPAPPTALQAAERHLALYRDAGFMTAADS
jgi:glycosyltransferase involved in cell wall biosynthesis